MSKLKKIQPDWWYSSKKNDISRAAASRESEPCTQLFCLSLPYLALMLFPHPFEHTTFTDELGDLHVQQQQKTHMIWNCHLSLTDTTFNLLKILKIKKLERRHTTPVWSIKPGLLWICGSDQTPPLCNCIWFLQHHSQHRATTPTNTVRILSLSLSVFLFS